MSRLEEMIQELCPDGVEFVAREQVLQKEIARIIAEIEG